MYAQTSKILLPLLLVTMIGCNAKSGDTNIVAENPNAPTLNLTADFDQVTTGWKNASNNNIAVQVDSSVNGASLECRLAHTSALAAAAYSPCSVVGGKVSLGQPSSGIKNGSFEFQVKASGGGAETIKSVKFYVHESLNSAAKCAPLKTDAQYLALAASYLDQSLPFGAATNVKNPFVKIAFPAVPVGNYIFTNGTSTDNYASTLGATEYGIRSLRKRFVPNNAKTLMLLKREYESRYNPNDCAFLFSGFGRDNMGNHPDLATGGVPPLPGDPSTFWNWRGYESRCDAVVFNSLKKGVCFSGNSIYFVSRLGRAFSTQFTNVGGIYSRRQRTASSKFTLAEKTEYDASIAQAIANGDTNARDHFIYLED